VSQQKAVVEKCTDGFREGDLTQILSCLSDDVVWVSLGGDPHAFVYSEVFTFTRGLVSRLDTFHIWLGEVPA
jgi:ketosteroid isomerase-like protein